MESVEPRPGISRRLRCSHGDEQFTRIDRKTSRASRASQDQRVRVHRRRRGHSGGFPQRHAGLGEPAPFTVASWPEGCVAQQPPASASL